MTIGWQEIVILLIILLLIAGPVLFRFFKRVIELQSYKDKGKD
jgi:hypothetical protein